MNEIFDRIDQLMISKKKKKKDLNDYLGLTHSSYNNWKLGTNESFLKYIDKIAEFLNVSPNYLLRGTDDIILDDNKQKQNETKLLRLFRSIPEHEADRLLIIVDAFVSSLDVRV
ncbi:MAG: helix-turn-helix domain-containing protein [Clostridia bacterium]|nr:helix-turn-helix domain-containing protein [Clostridia bacterium]